MDNQHQEVEQKFSRHPGCDILNAVLCWVTLAGYQVLTKTSLSPLLRWTGKGNQGKERERCLRNSMGKTASIERNEFDLLSVGPEEHDQTLKMPFPYPFLHPRLSCTPDFSTFPHLSGIEEGKGGVMVSESSSETELLTLFPCSNVCPSRGVSPSGAQIHHRFCRQAWQGLLSPWPTSHHNFVSDKRKSSAGFSQMTPQ